MRHRRFWKPVMRKWMVGLVIFGPALALIVAVIAMALQIQSERRDYALINAIKRSDTPAALGLLQQGANPNAADVPPEHASLWDVVLSCLPGYQPGQSEDPKFPALALAASDEKHENYEIVCELVRRGAKVNGTAPGYSTNSLLYALGNERERTVLFLLDHGADVSVQDAEDSRGNVWNDGQALIHRSTPVLRSLIAHGANVNAEIQLDTSLSCSPLFLVMNSRNNPHVKEQVQLMLDSGALMKDTRGWWESSPLLFAAEHSDSDVGRLLIERGADIHETDRWGRTCLDYAREAHNTAFVKMLIEAGEHK